MRKKALVSILGIFLLFGLIPQLASAETSAERVAPYDYGRVCHRAAGGGTPCTSSSDAKEKPCPDPSGTVPNLNCQKSELARRGILAINSFHPADVLNRESLEVSGTVYVPAPTTHQSSLGVYLPTPTSAGTLTASADIDGIDTVVPQSSSFVLCMNVMAWNTMVGQDCVNDSSEIRDLQAVANLEPGLQYRIVVQLYDYHGDHVAAVKVNKISYSTT